jgi:preprotein translocase subunit SecG
VYTFLTVLHVIVCIFLMLVVLLQAGRGGGIGLAFGGSGGSQSVFGSSGGATFLTKLTAICAIVFFTNSLALAYLSSQSDSRRLQKISEKKALAKKAEDATNVKMLTDIEKQREAQAKAAAAKSEALPEGTAGEENAPAAVDKAPAAEAKIPAAAGKASDDKPSQALKLTLPGQGAGKPGAPGKLAVDLKMGKPEKPAADTKPEKAEKPAAEKKVVNVEPAAKRKVALPKPAAEEAPAAGEKAAPEEKPAAEKKPAAAKKPAAEKKSDENSAEKPAAE